MPKKVLIIGLTDKLGGVETFIYNTTIFSNKKKYEYDFLVHGSNTCVFEKEINSFYGNKKHIHYIDSIKKKPFKVFTELIKFYKNNKYDYIHLQTGSTAEIMYVFPFILFLKTKLITHSHNGNGTNKVINSLFKPIVRLCTNVYLSCSEVAAKWLFGNIRKEKYTIIKNGIDTNRFKFNENAREKIREEYKINKNVKVIGHIGRFFIQKNHSKIIRIFNEILKNNKNFILLLLGTGECENQIRELVKKFKIEDSVIFAGTHMNTEDYYSAFDFFLMPSLYEGLPIVGVEAQSCGVKCFFSNTIDKQIMISKDSVMLDLNKSDKYWANQILNSDMVKDRNFSNKEVVENGYSLFSTVNLLESIYLGDKNEEK